LGIGESGLHDGRITGVAGAQRDGAVAAPLDLRDSISAGALGGQEG
jgi:hypothetical protein